jgi:branched-chain amino acid transport system permease protein
MVLQLMINGIVVGATYSLITTGYALLINLGVNNFSHGAVVMLGALFAHVWISSLGWPPLASLPLVLAAGVAVALLAYYIVIRRMLAQEKWSAVLVSTYAAALIIENAVLLLHGPDDFNVRNALIFGGRSILFGAIVTHVQILLVVVSLLLLGAATFILRRTGLGASIRAVAEDRPSAEAAGIATEKIIVICVCLSGGLAALSGLLISLDHDQNSSVGTDILLRSYIATVMAGGFSVYRLAAASFGIAIVESLVGGLLTTGLRFATVFAILIVFLLIDKKRFGSQGLRKV